ncbi:MAG: DUF4276 family protein [Deltaproteobacteria bacterium]|nr:DUF4276 family protein [Deltaproteobacteria bacterium]
MLVRRVAERLGFLETLELPQPLRVHRQKLPKPGELERAVELMARKVGDGGKLLIVLDADSDCPATLAPALLSRARAQRADRDIAIVLAKREYEAWLVTAAHSLRGFRTLGREIEAPPDAEALPSPKGWLGSRMKAGYSETIDQPALTAAFDVDAARRAPSFDKFVRDVASLLGVTEVRAGI